MPARSAATTFPSGPTAWEKGWKCNAQAKFEFSYKDNILEVKSSNEAVLLVAMEQDVLQHSGKGLRILPGKREKT